jgi:hypothetical protein
MPFKSRQQQKFFFAAEARGELPEGTAIRWAHETPDIKALPKKVRKKRKPAGESATASLVKAADALFTAK